MTAAIKKTFKIVITMLIGAVLALAAVATMLFYYVYDIAVTAAS